MGNSLDSKALHEHDVVPEGAVHVQVYLLDLRGEAACLLLHFLRTDKHTSCHSSDPGTRGHIHAYKSAGVTKPTHIE